jgi:hypothetical protein
VKARVLWSVAVALIAAGVVPAAATVDTKAELAKRIKSLQNVVVTYDWSNDVSQKGLEEQNRRTAGKSFALAVGAQRQIRLCYLDGKVRRETKEKNMPEPAVDDTSVMVVRNIEMASSGIEIQANGSTEALVRYRNDTVLKGSVRPGTVIRRDEVFEPMGMAAGDRWVDAELLNAGKEVSAFGDANTKGPVESVVPTLVFPMTRGLNSRWILSPEHGYAPAVQETVDANGFVWSRTVMSEWNRIGDVWIAYKAIEIGFAKGDDGRPRESGSKFVFAIKSCEIGSKENVPALYKMKWPDGTIVKGKDGKKYEAKGGELKPLKVRSSASGDDSLGMNIGRGEPLPDGAIIVNEKGERYELKGGQFRPIEPNQ